MNSSREIDEVFLFVIMDGDDGGVWRVDVRTESVVVENRGPFSIKGGELVWI
jgi:hypothetical protein